jgi:uncharacterized protein (DUF1786 family)
MSTPQIEDFTRRLYEGTLRHEEVFGSKGHGAFYAGGEAGSGRQEAGRRADMPLVAVTGPQRSRLVSSDLKPYFAAPHGDMMISGCFGMLRGFAHRHPAYREEIEAALGANRADG